MPNTRQGVAMRRIYLFEIYYVLRVYHKSKKINENELYKHLFMIEDVYYSYTIYIIKQFRICYRLL